MTCVQFSRQIGYVHACMVRYMYNLAMFHYSRIRAFLKSLEPHLVCVKFMNKFSATTCTCICIVSCKTLHVQHNAYADCLNRCYFTSFLRGRISFLGYQHFFRQYNHVAVTLKLQCSYSPICTPYSRKETTPGSSGTR